MGIIIETGKIIENNLSITNSRYNAITLEPPVAIINIGLLSIKDYLNAGGKDGYLNNSEYFWTSNTSENKAYYVFSDGGINNDSIKEIKES